VGNDLKLLFSADAVTPVAAAFRCVASATKLVHKNHILVCNSRLSAAVAATGVLT
jgi:hypothetical protein